MARDIATIADARHAEQRRRAERWNLEQIYRCRCAAAHAWARRVMTENANDGRRPLAIIDHVRKVSR